MCREIVFNYSEGQLKFIELECGVNFLPAVFALRKIQLLVVKEEQKLD